MYQDRSKPASNGEAYRDAAPELTPPPKYLYILKDLAEHAPRLIGSLAKETNGAVLDVRDVPHLHEESIIALRGLLRSGVRIALVAHDEQLKDLERWFPIDRREGQTYEAPSYSGRINGYVAAPHGSSFAEYYFAVNHINWPMVDKALATADLGGAPVHDLHRDDSSRAALIAGSQVIELHLLPGGLNHRALQQMIGLLEDVNQIKLSEPITIKFIGGTYDDYVLGRILRMARLGVDITLEGIPQDEKTSVHVAQLQKLLSGRVKLEFESSNAV